MIRHRLLRSLLLVAMLLGVVWTYSQIGSADHRGPWPVHMAYHDLQAEGFRSGHLYVPQEPDPRLLSKADPYDVANSRFWYIDLSLYRGKYYLYWGPVPALIQATVKAALGIDRMVGDQYLVFLFTSAIAVFGALMIDRMACRLFVGVPFALVLLTSAALAFSNPGPFLVASGGVYQASITGGQAFLLLGVLFAFDGVWHAARARLGAWRFFAAGSAWALAIGCRISLAPAIGAMALATVLVVLWPAAKRIQRGLGVALAIGLPLAAGVGALLLYNQLRFGGWLEFGTSLQLSHFKFRLDFAKYALVNAYTYLLRPDEHSCTFPFVFANWYPPVERSLPKFLPLPAGYLINEPVVGWLRAVPFAWLLPFGAVATSRALKALRRLPSPQQSEEHTRSSRVLIWCVLCLTFACTLTGALQMGLYMATMRYLSDVMYGMILISVMGAFWLYGAARSRSRIWAGATLGAISLLCVISIVYGLLLGYRGYGEQFKTHNPALHARMTEALSLCATGGL